MTVADVLIVWCWTMLFQLLYANAFPPRRMLLISGERSDYHLIEKINARDDKYMICETINYHMGKEALIEKSISMMRLLLVIFLLMKEM